MKETAAVSIGLHLLEIEVTSKCNLNCRHCYNRYEKNNNLPIEKVEELFLFAQNNWVKTVVISGGEAMLYKDFDNLITLIQRYKWDYRVVLQTNGTFINEKTLDKLRAFDLIHLSYDYNDIIRNNANNNLKRAIFLKTNWIKCYLFSSIHKQNKDYIQNMVQDANKSWIPIAFNICIPMHKLTNKDLLDDDEFFETEWLLYNLYKEGKILRYGSPLIAVRDETKESDYSWNKWWCTAWVAACIISSSGRVFPCPFLRIETWNIFEQGLKDIRLKSPIFVAFRQRDKFEWACKWCKFLSHCGWCRWRAYKLTGKLNGSDPKCYKDRFLQDNQNHPWNNVVTV